MISVLGMVLERLTLQIQPTLYSPESPNFCHSGSVDCVTEDGGGHHGDFVKHAAAVAPGVAQCLCLNRPFVVALLDRRDTVISQLQERCLPGRFWTLVLYYACAMYPMCIMFAA